MLDDHEREALRDVERRLLADDPEFARTFQDRQTSLQRDPRRRGAALAIIVAVLLTATMIAAGSVLGALVCAVITGLVWATWRHSTGGPPT